MYHHNDHVQWGLPTVNTRLPITHKIQVRIIKGKCSLRRKLVPITAMEKHPKTCDGLVKRAITGFVIGSVQTNMN